MPTESHFKPDKETEFRLYVIWKSLPRDIDTNLWQKLGVSDDTILELSQLKTQKEFAQKYDLDVGTLTDWNKVIREGNMPPDLKELDWRHWARQATPSVVSALLRNIRKHGKGADVNSWMKYVEGIEDRSSVTHEGVIPVALAPVNDKDLPKVESDDEVDDRIQQDP